MTRRVGLLLVTLLLAGAPAWAQTDRTFPGRVEILSAAADALKVAGRANVDTLALNTGGTSTDVLFKQTGAGQLSLRNVGDTIYSDLILRLLAPTTAVAIGAIPATAGAVRLANGFDITARNVGNSADIAVAIAYTDDKVYVGSAANDAGLVLRSAIGIELATGTGDVKWDKPLVNLGGGATPTFGTIGGSGPATAAQNKWLRLLDSTGAAIWVPVWK